MLAAKDLEIKDLEIKDVEMIELSATIDTGPNRWSPDNPALLARLGTSNVRPNGRARNALVRFASDKLVDRGPRGENVCSVGGLAPERRAARASSRLFHPTASMSVTRAPIEIIDYYHNHNLLD